MKLPTEGNFCIWQRALPLSRVRRSVAVMASSR
jgi:hypothetical protein